METFDIHGVMWYCYDLAIDRLGVGKKTCMDMCDIDAAGYYRWATMR